MYNKKVLSNGLRIVSEKMPYMRSVSIGIWVAAGSRNEVPEYNGISHFIEHMLFKGTEKRSAKQIAEDIDSIGGQLNAFTCKEYTCFYAKTLDTHIDIAFEILGDMFFNSKFLPKDIDIEKKVILEEIGMYEDSPEELVHDMLAEVVWNKNPLGYPILGSKTTLNNISRDTIIEYMKENYTPDNTVISIAGNFDDNHLDELIDKYFSNWTGTGKSENVYEKAHFNSGVKIRKKDTEQVHMCVGFNGIEHGNESLYPLLVVNNIFGGGMSSRLFQKVREEKGLVYSIYSYPSSYHETGLFGIYAGMNPDFMNNVIDILISEIKLLIKGKLTEYEFKKSKEQLKGSYMLGLESTSSRMTSIGKSELLISKLYTPEEILEKIENVSMNDVADVIDKVFHNKPVSLSVIGNIKGQPDFPKSIEIN